MHNSFLFHSILLPSSRSPTYDKRDRLMSKLYRLKYNEKKLKYCTNYVYITFQLSQILVCFFGGKMVSCYDIDINFSSSFEHQICRWCKAQ